MTPGVFKDEDREDIEELDDLLLNAQTHYETQEGYYNNHNNEFEDGRGNN